MYSQLEKATEIILICTHQSPLWELLFSVNICSGNQAHTLFFSICNLLISVFVQITMIIILFYENTELLWTLKFSLKFPSSSRPLLTH